MSADVDNLDRLNRNLAEYLKHTKQTVQEAIAKQGAKLSFALAARLKQEAPGKGTIRAERLAALKSGGGVLVRKSLRDKIKPRQRNRRGSLNVQARRVRAELNLRERGKGFLAHGTRINTGKLSRESTGRISKHGRYRQLLASAGLQFDPDTAQVQFIYGGARTELGTTLAKPRFRKHINSALGEVADDIQIYLDRKLAEANR